MPRVRARARAGRLLGSLGALVILGGNLATQSAAEQLPLRVYSSVEGLGNDNAHAALQDSRGFLWFGTESGLSRFDGVAFVNFTVEHGLPAPVAVHALLETRGRTLWIGTEGGLCRLLDEPSRPGDSICQNQRLDDSGALSEVLALYQDASDRLWVGTGTGLFVAQDPEGDAVSFRRVPLALACSRPGRDRVTRVTGDGSEGLWLATRCGVVHVDSGEEVKHRRFAAVDDDRVFDVALDAEGRLWIAHVDLGVAIWWPEPDLTAVAWTLPLVEQAKKSARGDRGELPHRPGEVAHWTTRDGLPHDHVRNGLLASRTGSMWIGTVWGLAKWDGRELRSYTTRHGFPDNTLRPRLEDAFGNLWFASPFNGVARLAPHDLASFTTADGLAGPYVRSISEGPLGELYVQSAGDRDAIHRRDGERFVAVLPNLRGRSLSGWAYQQIGFLSREGEWWLPAATLLRFPRLERLEELSAAAPRSYGPREGLLGEPHTLFEDRAGDVWIGLWTAGGHLARWRRASDRIEVFGPEAGIPESAPLTFAETSGGSLWIGFGDGTLLRRREERFERFPLEGSAGYGTLYVDRSGALLIGAQQGLRIPDPDAAAPRRENFGRMATAHSPVSSVIVEDLSGRYYFGTDRGVDRFDPKSGEWRHYGVAEGLAHSWVTCAFRDRAGDLWFGTVRGLSRFRPRDEPGVPPPPIYLAELSVAGRPLLLSARGVRRVDDVQLTSGAEGLEVSFAGLSFAPGERLRYQLRFGGGKWSLPRESRDLLIADLSPGTHRLEVRAVAADGAASPEPASLELRVLAPLWRRPWFVGTMMLGVILAGYATQQARHRRRLEVERVRTRIATDLHDDIGAGLTRIAILSEVAQRRAEPPGGDERGGKGELPEIAESARTLIQSMSDLVWAIRPERGDLRGLLARLRHFASGIFEPVGIEWNIEASENAAELLLAQDTRQHLLLLVQEALANIGRHAGARNVLVQFATDGGRLSVRIRDDGAGFSLSGADAAAEEGRGNGLRNMRVRCRELKGELRIESTPGSGTTLSLDMPLVQARRRSGA